MITPGHTTGMITRRNASQEVQPSTLALWSSSVGRFSKKAVSIGHEVERRAAPGGAARHGRLPRARPKVRRARTVTGESSATTPGMVSTEVAAAEDRRRVSPSRSE